MAVRADDVDLARDSLLVERFQAGDAAAFDDLYRRYFSRLRRFCLRRVGDPHEAEELAQEAFTKAFRAMPSFAGERRFYPWMTVIASRLCIDSHRRRSRSIPEAEIDLGTVDDHHDELFAAVDRAYLERALERLAPRHREVLALREEQGWSYQRIADHYGVSLGTVEALLHRARRSLRREFEKLTGASVWAGLPVLGWLARRTMGIRQRAADVAPLATPLSATVASVVIAVGVTLVAPPADPPRPSPRVVAEPVASTAPAPPDSAPTTAPPPPLTSAPAPGHASPPPTAARPLPVRADYESARSFNADAPVTNAIEGVASLGSDPAAVVHDTTGFVTDALLLLGRITTP